MTAKDKTYLFETMPVPRAVASLAIPTVISSLVMILYNLADTYFVGLLNDPVQSAAVTLASPVILLFNALVNLFGVGCASLMSRSLGSRDYDTVHKSSAFGIYGALISSLSFSLLYLLFRDPVLNIIGADEITRSATAQYMRWTVLFGAVPSIMNVVISNLIRSEGASLHASIGVIGGCILNVILDPFFILPIGLNMGSSGAGLATMISNIAACCYFLAYLTLRRADTYISLDPRDFRPRRTLVSSVAAVGIPAAIQNILNVTSYTVLNNMTSAYGTDAVAAMGIAHKVELIPVYVAMGLAQGVMPLIGYNYASGNAKRMRSGIGFTAVLTTAITLLASAFFYFGAGTVIGAFMENPSVVAYGSRFLRGFAPALPFLSIDFLAVGIFQAVGMGRESLIFALLRKVVLEIPALIILDRLFPLYGMPYSHLCAELILAAAAVAVVMKLLKNTEDKNNYKESAI